MSKVFASTIDLIGKTPLLELSHIEKEENLKAKVIVKLELYNPGGSVKDENSATPSFEKYLTAGPI